MSNYRRYWQPGGTYFITQVSFNRQPFLTSALARSILRDVISDVRAKQPFEVLAIVLLPDHFHAIIRLHEGDDDYARRMGAIKAQFTRAWLSAGGQERAPSPSRQKRNGRGVWQRRYWEHTCRDVEDLQRHLDYIHWNPIKHGYATCPHAWQWSTFEKWVQRGVYPRDWRCRCDGRKVEPFDGADLENTAME